MVCVGPLAIALPGGVSPPTFDPFGRTAALVPNPVEAQWRETVAATISEPPPLVHPAQLRSSQPYATGPMAAGVQAAENSRLTAASGGTLRGSALAPLPPKAAAGKAASAVTGAAGQPALLQQLQQLQGATASGPGSPGRGPVKASELMQTVAASLGWGGNPLRLAEVPEAFWQTVSPEVHSQINEFLFEQVRSLALR